MSNDWTPDPITQFVYDQLIEHFDEPDHGFTFDGGNSVQETPDHYPQRVDVFAWDPDEEVDITSFATVGMASKPMFECEHRSEIHLGVRAKLDEQQLNQFAIFLANLSTYPFHRRTHFDWWHKIHRPGKLPLFKEPCIVMHPGFSEETWDKMEFNGTEIKILNVIPISEELYAIKSASELRNRIWEPPNDPFLPS